MKEVLDPRDNHLTREKEAQSPVRVLVPQKDQAVGDQLTSCRGKACYMQGADSPTWQVLSGGGKQW